MLLLRAHRFYNSVSTAPIAAKTKSKMRIIRVERTIGLKVGISKWKVSVQLSDYIYPFLKARAKKTSLVKARFYELSKSEAHKVCREYVT